MNEIACKNCGKAFTPARHGTLYCAPECKEAYHLRKSFCERCGRAIMSKQKRRRFCSKECREAQSGCDNCRHCHGGSICPWVTRGKPVPGWNAIPTRPANGPPGYRILYCPMHEAGRLP